MDTFGGYFEDDHGVDFEDDHDVDDRDVVYAATTKSSKSSQIFDGPRFAEFDTNVTSTKSAKKQQYTSDESVRDDFGAKSGKATKNRKATKVRKVKKNAKKGKDYSSMPSSAPTVTPSPTNQADFERSILYSSIT